MTPNYAKDLRHLARGLREAGEVTLLSEFCRELERNPPRLSQGQREALIEQTAVLLRELYVHLPVKRAVHAIDPLQRLEVLRRDAPGLGGWQFHQELLSIFKSLRDIHTAYTLPEPYSRCVAFLPFLLEDCYERGKHTLIVSRVFGDRGRRTPFRPGVTVTTWNGMRVERAVARNAEREEGSNDSARFAMGLLFMTVRWLGASLPPDEDWVLIGYGSGRRELEIRLPWYVLALAGEPIDNPLQALSALEGASEATPDPSKLCLNLRSRIEHNTRRLIFAQPPPARGSTRRRARRPTRARPIEVPSLLPSLFQASKLAGGVGYIRLRAFEGVSVEIFVAEFSRLLAEMPQDGLILDIRGNPGGNVECGECLLQLLTPREISPVLFQFLASPLTEKLTHPPNRRPRRMSAASWEPRRVLAEWGPSTRLAVEMGGSHSGGVPLTSPAAANAIGQRYYGPCVLIVDALCFSTADIFAAGFQDHEIGPIIGVEKATGAAGANVWAHDFLARRFPDGRPDLRPLRGGGRIRVAIRRCTRVGPHAGMPIEEVGVRPDVDYHLTRNDVLNHNQDLLAFAAGLLAKRRRRRLDVSVTRAGQELEIAADSLNIDRLDVFVQERPCASADVLARRTTRLRVSTRGENTCSVELRGYSVGALVARWKQVC